MKILIIGGGGFIGSHTARHLVKNNKISAADISFREKIPGIKYYKINILSEEFSEEIVAILRKEKPEAVYYFAAYMPKFKEKEGSFVDKHVKIGPLGVLAVLEAIEKEGSFVKKFIFSSSAAVYGKTSVFPTPENSPLNPILLYGRMKRYCEELVGLYCQFLEIDYVILRYGTVYGPGQKFNKKGSFVASLVNGIDKIKEIKINKNQTRDFIYIDDVIRANSAALNRKAKGMYNIGSGTETSVKQLCDEISRILGKKVKIKYSDSKNSKIERNVLNIKKAKKELKWAPKVSLKEGLLKAI